MKKSRSNDWLVGAAILATMVLVVATTLFLQQADLGEKREGISARFRDAVAVIPMAMQAGVFLTPIAYSIAGAPDLLQAALWLNPVTGIMEAWRWAILDVAPSVPALLTSAAWTVVLPMIGWWVFSRLEIGFADYL